MHSDVRREKQKGSSRLGEMCTYQETMGEFVECRTQNAVPRLARLRLRIREILTSLHSRFVMHASHLKSRPTAATHTAYQNRMNKSMMLMSANHLLNAHVYVIDGRDTSFRGNRQYE